MEILVHNPSLPPQGSLQVGPEDWSMETPPHNRSLPSQESLEVGSEDVNVETSPHNRSLPPRESLEVGPEDVTFLETLRVSDCSVMFKILLRDKTYIMKVFHGVPFNQAHNPEMEHDPYVCEAAAYERLKANGFCDRGDIPDFLGVIPNIQLDLWPALEDWFDQDELPPNAIIIEYIPDLEPIDVSNLTSKYLQGFRRLLEEMHAVGVLHDDTYPRNMMISKERDKAIWIDFDRAQTIPDNRNRTDKEATWFVEEMELVDEFLELITQDLKTGELKKAWEFFYIYG